MQPTWPELDGFNAMFEAASKALRRTEEALYFMQIDQDGELAREAQLILMVHRLKRGSRR